MNTLDKAHELQRLHADPELLLLVNVWDAITAKVVAVYPVCTIARAIGVVIVRANLVDQLKPLPDAVRAVSDAVAAGERAGVPFVLNARTDAFLRAGEKDPAAVLADAIERGRAYLDAGASTFFAPGLLDEATVTALVEALGPQKVNLIGIPGSLPLETMQRLAVARVSYGPWSQNVALTALANLAADVRAGGGIPENTRRLN